MSVSARAALIAAVALCASAVTVAQSEGRAYQYNSQEGDDYDYEVEDLSGGAVAGIITGSIISLLVCVCLPLCCLLAWMGVPFAVGFGLVRKQRGQDQSWRQQQHQQQAHQMAAHPGAQGSGQWQAPGEWRQQPAQYPHHAPGPYQQHMHQPPQPPPPVYQPSYDYEAGQPAAAPPAGWQNGHNAHQSTHSSHGSWQYGAAGQKGGDEAAGGAKV